MQILFLSHRLPYPPDKGERIRAFQQLQYLGTRHDVDLFCFADSPECAQHATSLQNKCRSVHVEVLRRTTRTLRAARNFATAKPMSFGFFDSPHFAAHVQGALQKHRYDIIFVYSSSMGQHLMQPLQAPLVVDFVDADSQKFRQYADRSGHLLGWFYRREARAVAAAEAWLGRAAAVSFAVTAHDARELEHDHGFHVQVIPNGVQVPAGQSRNPHIAELRPFLLFVGTMNYPPNVDAAVYFAQDIFPLVRKSRPELTFVIVGRDPDRRVRELNSIPGVVVMGGVSDPFEYFRNAAVSVAPFRISQGFHNKIAESLAVGTPVVSTRRAQAGIGLSEKEGLFVADDAQEFAETVLKALKRDLRFQLQEQAGAVQSMLSWDIRLARMEQFILAAAAGRDTSVCEAVAGR